VLDSHCHLAGPEFADDLSAVVDRAGAAGVDTVLCILEAEDNAEVQRAAAIRSAWPSARFATGIHPHHAGKFAGDLEVARRTVEAALGSANACAVGEIGLDYHYDFSPRVAQQDVFRLQLRLAVELQHPVIIHTREATEDTFGILREAKAARGVFHCFTGDAQMAREALDLGFYLSFAGIVTFPKADELREVARMTPLDRILSETDAPYLAPVPYRGKRNEPAYVARVVETLANLHGVSPEAIAAQVETNFAALFG
jgi:TatD DNase family protein